MPNIWYLPDPFAVGGGSACPNRKYIVRLCCDERKHLQDLVSKGRTQAYRIRHAHILMKADADGPCWGDEAIAQAFSCHRRTAEGIRKRFVLQGLDGAPDMTREKWTVD